MSDKTIFTKLAKKIRNPHSGLKHPQIAHPAREWFLGILFSLIIFSLSAYWSVRSYLIYDEIALSQDTEIVSETIIYQAPLVQAALKELSDREAKHNTLLSGGVVQEADQEAPIDEESREAGEVDAEADSENVNEAGDQSEGEISDVIPEGEEVPEDTPAIGPDSETEASEVEAEIEDIDDFEPPTPAIL